MMDQPSGPTLTWLLMKPEPSGGLRSRAWSSAKPDKPVAPVSLNDPTNICELIKEKV